MKPFSLSVSVLSMCPFINLSVCPSGGERFVRLMRSGTICSDDDSDGEADRRMATMFNTHKVINPDEDTDLLKFKHTPTHKRASSLPPPVVVEITSSKASPPPPLPARMYEDEDVDGKGEMDEGLHDNTMDEEGGTKTGMESSLDRSPSHMRKTLKKPPESVSGGGRMGEIRVRLSLVGC